MSLLLRSERLEAPWCKARIIETREYRTSGESRREREVGSINVWEALDMSVTTTKQGTTATARWRRGVRGKWGKIQEDPKNASRVIDYQPIGTTGKCEDSNEFELKVSNKRSRKVVHRNTE